MGSPRQATEPYAPSTMGSKNGKPVLTDDQAQALANSSGLDVVQVREHFDAFVAEHPNGKMKKKDFREMMSKALPKKGAGKMEKHGFSRVHGCLLYYVGWDSHGGPGQNF